MAVDIVAVVLWIVAAGVGVIALYWIIRLSVRHALADARAPLSEQRPQATPSAPPEGGWTRESWEKSQSD